jgi:hypothetical protein
MQILSYIPDSLDDVTVLFAGFVPVCSQRNELLFEFVIGKGFQVLPSDNLPFPSNGTCYES